MNNPDRFDRMLLGAEPVPVRMSASLPRRQLVPIAALVERTPVITSSRSPRFVDHTACPMCGVNDLGIEFHGVLMTGAKVNMMAAHTPGFRNVKRARPRCLGTGMRVVFEGGAWKGLASP